jgi:hypothetical protein
MPNYLNEFREIHRFYDIAINAYGSSAQAVSLRGVSVVEATANGFMVSCDLLSASPNWFRALDPWLFHSQYALRPSRQQSSPPQVEVGQRECGEGTHRVLVDAAVAYLVKPHRRLTTWKGCSPRARVRERLRLISF